MERTLGRVSPAGDPRRRERLLTLVVALAALGIGIAGVLWRHGLGLGLTSDSTEYLSVAYNLAHGRGLVDFGGTPLVTWPPLYPVLVAAGILAGLPIMGAVGVINVGSLVATGVCAFRLARRTADEGVAILTTAAVVLAGAVTFVSSFAWSEPPYIALSLVTLWSYLRWRERGGWGRALGCGLAVTAAFLTRYGGVDLIAALALAALIEGPSPRRARTLADLRRDAGRPTMAARLRAGVMTGLVTGVGPALWVVRNLVVSHSAFGFRPPANEGLSYELVSYVHAFEAQLIGPLAVTTAFWLAASLGLGAGLTLYAFAHAEGAPTDRVVGRRTTLVLALYGIVFTIDSIYTSVATAIDRFDTRLMAPVVPVVLLLVGVLVGRSRSTWRRLGVTGLAVLALYQFSASAQTFVVAGGLPVPIPRADAGGLVRAVDRLAPSVGVITDVPSALWAFDPGRRIERAPLHEVYNSSLVLPLPRSFVRAVARHPVIYAYFGYPVSWTPQAMAAAGVRVRLLHQFPDGQEYLVGGSSGR